MMLFWIVAGIATVGLVVYYFFSQKKERGVSIVRPEPEEAEVEKVEEGKEEKEVKEGKKEEETKFKEE